MSLEHKKVIIEIFEDAYERIGRARDGKPGELVPEITEGDRNVLDSAQKILSITQGRVLCKIDHIEKLHQPERSSC